MDTDSILRQSSPYKSSESYPLDERALDDLRGILEGELPRLHGARHSPGRRVPLLVAAATVVALATTIVGVTVRQPNAAAATPPVITAHGGTANAADMLGQIITNVEASGAQSDSLPRASYQQWALWTRVEGNVVKSAVVPQEYDSQCNTAGACTTSMAYGEPTGELSIKDRVLMVTGEWFGKHETRTTWTLSSGIFATKPPTSTADMIAYLSKSHPIQQQGTPELLVAVEDLSMTWTLGDRSRAAILAILAEQEDLRFDGIATDRLGRQGHVFSVHSNHGGLPNRMSIIVDEKTGKVLGGEKTLTSDPGLLDVEIPATISYTAFR